MYQESEVGEIEGRVCDAVIVGGGIAGASLAGALAAAGRSVVVLEATEQFDDRVRGESMQPWGVLEAQRLGVADVLMQAGAHVAPMWKRYRQGCDDPSEIPVGMLVPGVAGSLNLHHPVACQALLDVAAKEGATVLRGVRDVAVTPGVRPSVTFRIDGVRRTIAAAVVVGADGRASAVRRAAGISLQQQDASGFVAGMLLDHVDLPDDHDVIAEHDRGMFLLLHQGGGRARAYHVVALDDRTRYAGPGGARQFLADAASSGMPGAGALRAARPAGPCASFPGTDTWTDRPVADGVVLIGDAAGHNDPTVGCGLSIAMRDARLVRDLLLDGRRPVDGFASYCAERSARMATLRLLADLMHAACIEPSANRPARRALFANAMAAMDAEIFPLVLGMFAGPEHVPAHLVNGGVLDRVRAA